MDEAYTVKFMKQKDDGYWAPFEETVLLNNKGEHEKAAHIIEKKYKNIKIVNVKFQ